MSRCAGPAVQAGTAHPGPCPASLVACYVASIPWPRSTVSTARSRSWSKSSVRPWVGIAAAVAVLIAAVGVAGRSQIGVGASSATETAGAPSHTTPAADTQQVTIAVSGMVCESCERTIAVMLARTPGVFRATVNVARGEAVVYFDPARTAPAKLVAVVEQLGYEATIKKA